MTESAKSGKETERAASVRALVRACDRAMLATRLVDDEQGGDWPYASLVMVACGPDGSPLLLLSDLAEHTRNATADARASLLYDGTGGLDNPLTGTRATLLGRIEKCGGEALTERYLRRHPDARDFVEFTDFNLYRMTVERAHLVAGFGAIHWLAGADVVPSEGAALADGETDIVDHMNADHAEAIALYAGRLLGLEGDGWTMTGIDAEGLDLRLGGAVARLGFERAVTDPDAARAALVDLAAKARGAGGASGE